MSSKSLTGRVWMQPQFAASGFELSFPVADLIVDDPDARRAAGSDFPPDIPAADKEGTRKNMLREEVLDGESYPRVEVKSAKVGGSLQAPQVTARITIKRCEPRGGGAGQSPPSTAIDLPPAANSRSCKPTLASSPSASRSARWK